MDKAKSGKPADDHLPDSDLRAGKKRSFGPDRKGESSAGAVEEDDKKLSVEADRDGSNTR
jgi:hypothetical protein